MENKSFQELITIAKEKKIKKSLANEFEVSESTIDRWESGIALPHLKTQEQIKKFILSRVYFLK